MVNGIKDYEFQNDCVDFLIDKTAEYQSKQVITVKAPTGAGKTVILIKYIDEYLKNTDGKTAFVCSVESFVGSYAEKTSEH